jgi:aerobic carbon-monoxide dehydrogenase medium subunit
MKPAPFEYARPGTLGEALSLLAEDGVRLIAGGQSLVPLLALRMTAPRLLVDISRLSELKGIDIGPQGIRLGALTRWCDVLKHPQLATHHPLLVEAIGHVAHYQIRNRGTVGGSCSHADPSAEMPAIAVTCDAQFEIASLRGTRTLPAEEFFQGILTTALEPDELLIAIRLPRWTAGRRYAFQEFARRTGDFAIAGCALFWDEDGGRCINPHVGVFGVADTALRLPAVEAALAGQPVTPGLIVKAADLAQQAVVPREDLHAPAAYRSDLMRVMVERALSSAAAIPAGVAA